MLVVWLLVGALAAAEHATESDPGNPKVTPMVKDAALKSGTLGADSESAEDSVWDTGSQPSEPKSFPGAAKADSSSPKAGVASPKAGGALPKPDLDKSAGRTASVALGLLPLAVRGTGVESVEREAVEEAIRLGASEGGKYWVWSAEETGRKLPGGSAHTQDCFSERCLEASARTLGIGLVLAAQYGREDSISVLKLVLLEGATGKVRSALEARRRIDFDSLIPFAREAAGCLLAGHGGRDLVFTTDRWHDISWLNPKESLDNRRPFGWMGSGLLVAATGLAWAEGQLINRDDNQTHPSGAILDGDGPRSFLRGFFADPDLGARYAAMGGAGIAHVDNGLALMMNPAGVAGSDHASAVAAKGNLPGGTPSLFLAYAGPFYGRWSQGLGVQYQGDALASETTMEGALAYDLAAFGKAFEGVKAGAELKLYLADVGRAGIGLEKSTGHSFGAGLDIGLQAKLTAKMTAALSVRDALSLLRHDNTLTDRGYEEVLPPEYRVGAAYRASKTLLLLMDGQKGMYADQADHVRLGVEKITFGFLALRCGMHQIFGREAVRKLSVGFGINTEGLGEVAVQSHVALNYGYEFGINQDEPLGGGQQFSVEMGF